MFLKEHFINIYTQSIIGVVSWWKVATLLLESKEVALYDLLHELKYRNVIE